MNETKTKTFNFMQICLSVICLNDGDHHIFFSATRDVLQLRQLKKTFTITVGDGHFGRLARDYLFRSCFKIFHDVVCTHTV
jgi:hypothetical protein